MKSSALIAVLTLALGMGLLIAGAVRRDDISFFALTLSPRIVQGVGLISTIFGVVTILTAIRSLQPHPHTHADGRQQVSDE
jgi:hypothetical protein